MADELKMRDMKVQFVQGSYLVYIPKNWCDMMGITKGDTVTWFLDENDHDTLKLRKREES
jgi:hypothetical protein